MNLNSKIKYLLFKNNIDGYLIPKNDEYFSEYSNPDRLKSISNFSGSAGIAMILFNKNYLFVDGRYKIQAEKESGNSFEIHEITNIDPKYILKKFKNKIKLGFDPKLFTSSYLKKNIKPFCKMIPIKKNLVDIVDTKKKKFNTNYFYTLNSKSTGESKEKKINRLISFLKKKKIDNIFISAPENVAWLLNIRGYDNPNSPIPNCQLLINNKKKIFLFADKKKAKKIKLNKKYRNIIICNKTKFLKILNLLNGKSFLIDGKTCSNYYERLILYKFKIKERSDPCYDFKSIKNKVEIKNTINAHISDGVALTKFIYWIKNINKKQIDELYVKKKVEYFRKKNKNYLFPSFNSIVGSGPNGAIIHYNVNKKSNRKINKKDILLLDTGGQYKYGTTDVTRTLCFSKPNDYIKKIYTRVLKGHISVTTTALNKFTTGRSIDKRGRYFLKEINLDYPHGTGHGVGYFLNVHEGPQSLSKYNFKPLCEGMILSNEPGFYKKNKFGVRIENLLIISKTKKYKFFENLTLVPLDYDLIDFKMLDKKEMKYLQKYHVNIYQKLSKYLTDKEKEWLAKSINQF